MMTNFTMEPLWTTVDDNTVGQTWVNSTHSSTVGQGWFNSTHSGHYNESLEFMDPTIRIAEEFM